MQGLMFYGMEVGRYTETFGVCQKSWVHVERSVYRIGFARKNFLNQILFFKTIILIYIFQIIYFVHTRPYL